MTATDPTDLQALRELADDILRSATEPVLDVQQVGLDYNPKLWATLTEAGLTLLTTPESRSGTGATLSELAVVLESSGYHAAPIPLAEHDLLASWLLGVAGLPLGGGPMTAAVTNAQLQDARLTTTLEHVPWISATELLVVLGDGFIAAIPRDDVTTELQVDIAGQPNGRVRVDVELQENQFHVVETDLSQEFTLRGALARSLQTCGALTRALELTCDHAQQREQFGRPIAKFQAVQALVANAAGALALAKTATQFATESVLSHGFESPEGRFAVAVAKIESARAATLVARNAHQVHGAIGFTLDHRLRHFTNRALAWRAEFGVERKWQRLLGELVLDSREDVWELVTRLTSGIAQQDHN